MRQMADTSVVVAALLGDISFGLLYDGAAQRPEKAVRKGREAHKQQRIECRLLRDQDRED
jgi:hypothetical protein